MNIKTLLLLIFHFYFSIKNGFELFFFIFETSLLISLQLTLRGTVCCLSAQELLDINSYKELIRIIIDYIMIIEYFNIIITILLLLLYVFKFIAIVVITDGFYIIKFFLKCSRIFQTCGG